jgi:hypothetical protein
MSESRSAEAAELPEWVAIVRQKVAAIRFGTVQIVVHDGRVTLVESTEKTRVETKAARERD